MRHWPRFLQPSAHRQSDDACEVVAGIVQTNCLNQPCYQNPRMKGFDCVLELIPRSIPDFSQILDQRFESLNSPGSLPNCKRCSLRLECKIPNLDWSSPEGC